MTRTLGVALVALGAGPAWGAELDRYPVCAEVVGLEAAGAVRVRVPLALRSPADPPDGSDLVLVDAEGRPVPVQRVEDPAVGDAVELPAHEPTADPERFVVATGALALTGLRVVLPPTVPAAEVTVSAGDRTLVDRALVWRLAGSQSTDVTWDTGAQGPLTVVVHPTSGVSLGAGPRFVGLRRPAVRVPEHRVDATLGPTSIQENGWARTPLVLPRPLPVAGVVVQAADPLYTRTAGLAVVPTLQPLELGYEPDPRTPMTLTRATIGEISVRQEIVRDRIPVGASDQLLLLVDARNKVPLEVTGATVLVDGVDLLAVDAGPGPHRLCGGASPGTTPTSPLGEATLELARIAPDAVEPGPVAPNPAYVPPEIRSNLAAPGDGSDTHRLRWGRPVTGTPGMSRIPVPNEVVVRARPDLGDVRLVSDVDGDGRAESQLPYLLLREPADRPVEVTTERQERAGRSHLAVRLPERGLRVSRIALHTEAELFDREVVVSLPAQGDRLRPLRAVRWVGADRPNVLMIELNAAIDDELLVTIDNGDDPPLSIDRVEVAVAGYALMASLPEGAAVTLAYGDPGLAAPEFDLYLLHDAISQRALAVPVAVVGDEQAIERPPLSGLDRALLAVGIGVLALGVLGLGIDLVRRLPKPSGSALGREPSP